MAVTTVKTLRKTWGRIKSVGAGYTAIYYPGNSDPANTVVVYGPDGTERTRNTDPLRDYDLAVGPNGELVVDYLTYADGSDDHLWKRWFTGVFVGDALPPAPPPAGGGAMPPTPPATVDLGPLVGKLNELASAVDQLHTDVVGRLKAHDATENDRIGALGAMIAKVPAEIIGEVPAGDHFGLDPRAQFNNVWQELFAYVLTARQDTLQVAVERFFEACRNMDKEGYNWETGKYDLPKK